MNKKEIKKLLNTYRISPTKKLGQNFLLSQKAISEILTLANIKDDDIILEIGAGTGILTKKLANLSSKVLAIEKDEKLTLILQNILKSYDNIDFFQEDVRDFISRPDSPIKKLKNYKIVANLPYYLSSFIIRKFLERENKPKLMVLTLQKELVDRICASPGQMSILSVMVNFYSTPGKGSIIKKTSFYPCPGVDSRILLIQNIHQPEKIDSKHFFRIVRIGFSAKRKKLINNLKGGLKKDKEELASIFEQLGVSKNARAQELTVEEWKKLARLL